MTYEEALALIEEYTDYSGFVDKHGLAVAISDAEDETTS